MTAFSPKPFSASTVPQIGLEAIIICILFLSMNKYFSLINQFDHNKVFLTIIDIKIIDHMFGYLFVKTVIDIEIKL